MDQVFNPYLPEWEYIPDGEPYVIGDRVYVYVYNQTDKPVPAVTVDLDGRHKAVPFDFGKSAFRGGKRLKAVGGKLAVPVELAPRHEALFEIK